MNSEHKCKLITTGFILQLLTVHLYTAAHIAYSKAVEKYLLIFAPLYVFFYVYYGKNEIGMQTINRQSSPSIRAMHFIFAVDLMFFGFFS